MRTTIYFDDTVELDMGNEYESRINLEVEAILEYDDDNQLECIEFTATNIDADDGINYALKVSNLILMYWEEKAAEKSMAEIDYFGGFTVYASNRKYA